MSRDNSGASERQRVSNYGKNRTRCEKEALLTHHQMTSRQHATRSPPRNVHSIQIFLETTSFHVFPQCSLKQWPELGITISLPMDYSFVQAEGTGIYSSLLEVTEIVYDSPVELRR